MRNRSKLMTFYAPDMKTAHAITIFDDICIATCNRRDLAWNLLTSMYD